MADAIQLSAEELAQIQKEVAELEAGGKLEDEYLSIRTRQKVQQKKQQGSGAMKKYQARKREREKLIRQIIEQKNRAAHLDEQADAAAEAKLTSEANEEEQVSA